MQRLFCLWRWLPPMPMPFGTAMFTITRKPTPRYGEHRGAKRHRDVHHNAEANAATVNEAGNQAAQPQQKDMKQGKPCKKCDKHDMKAMKKMQKRSPEHWLAKEDAEINEDYNEAVYKIGKTSLPQDAKDLLLSQAQANKELALKQAKEKSDLMMKNMEAREKFRDQIMQEKRNRKAVREIEDIL